MPCFPGFFPVIKQAQATEETVGKTEFMGQMLPCSKMRARWGSSPSRVKRVMRLWGVPSKPMTTTRFSLEDLAAAEVLSFWFRTLIALLPPKMITQIEI